MAVGQATSSDHWCQGRGPSGTASPARLPVSLGIGFWVADKFPQPVGITSSSPSSWHCHETQRLSGHSLCTSLSFLLGNPQKISSSQGSDSLQGRPFCSP